MSNATTKVTTDDIKKILVNDPSIGGTLKDWKRGSRTIVPDTNSVIQRVFNNASTGQEITTHEISDLEDAYRYKNSKRFPHKVNGALVLVWESKAKQSGFNFEPDLETDPVKIAAAQEAVRIMIEDQYNHGNKKIKKDWEDRFQEQYKIAGQRAFFNQFIFALNTQEGENEHAQWYCTPKVQFEKENCVWDGWVPYSIFQDSEGMKCHNPNKTYEQEASRFLSMGYQFDEKFQTLIDKTHLKLLSENYQNGILPQEKIKLDNEKSLLEDQKKENSIQLIELLVNQPENWQETFWEIVGKGIDPKIFYGGFFIALQELNPDEEVWVTTPADHYLKTGEIIDISSLEKDGKNLSRITFKNSHNMNSTHESLQKFLDMKRFINHYGYSMNINYQKQINPEFVDVIQQHLDTKNTRPEDIADQFLNNKKGTELDPEPK